MANTQKSSDQAKSKAQIIRDALTSDPDIMPKEIAERLSAQGLKVSAQEVSQVKYQLKTEKKTRGPKTARKTVAAAPRTDDMISVAALQKAKKLVQELGGVDEAKQALVALGQLLD